MSGEASATGSRVTLHVVSSLDGFIARKDNSVSWMDVQGSNYEAGISISEDEAAAFIRAIDCYVLGSRTYEHALELGWPYGDTPTVVVDVARSFNAGAVFNLRGALRDGGGRARPYPTWRSGFRRCALRPGCWSKSPCCFRETERRRGAARGAGVDVGIARRSATRWIGRRGVCDRSRRGGDRR
jgi:hypothetical protein